MKNQSLSLVSVIALLATAPTSATADVKDAIVGGIIGGVVSGAIQNQQRKKTTTKRTTVVRRAAPSLNSQFSRNERIQIQSALRDQGYRIGTVDGILGNNSRAAIRQYQASLGERQTGQLTSSQYALLIGAGGQQFAQPQTINRQLNPTEVALMQQSLQRLGYYRGIIDGVNGPGTRAAAAGYLGSQGISPVGLTNVQTLVTVASGAGFVAPPYLLQEANAATQFAAPQTQQPLGTPQTQQAFGSPQVQQPFGAQPQQAFGTQPQQFGQQPGVGVTVPQQPQPGTTSIFGTPQGQQQNTFGTAPQQGQTVQQQPQQGQGSPLFAAGSGAVVTPQAGGVVAGQQALFPQGATQPVAAPQAPQSTLDIFAPTTTGAAFPVQQ